MNEKLKQEMKRQGISGNRLAMIAGITPSDFYAAIHGKKPFFPAWRRRVANALGTTETELFDDRK